MLATPKDKLVKGFATKVSPDEIVRAAMESREDHLRSEVMSNLSPVQVTLDGLRFVADKQALPEVRVMT